MEHLKLYEEFEFKPKGWFKKQINIKEYKDDIDDILLDLKDMSFESICGFNDIVFTTRSKKPIKTWCASEDRANSLDCIFFIEDYEDVTEEIKDEIEVIIKRIKDLNKNINVEYYSTTEEDFNKGDVRVLYFIFTSVKSKEIRSIIYRFYDNMLLKVRKETNIELVEPDDDENWGEDHEEEGEEELGDWGEEQEDGGVNEDKNNELDYLMDLFMEISDMKYDYYKIRGGDDKDYKIVHDLKGEITKSGNFLIDVYVDYIYKHYISQEMKSDIYPRIKSSGYKVISVKEVKTSQSVAKDIPVYGKDRTSRVYDPIYKISVLIKKEKNEDKKI